MKRMPVRIGTERGSLSGAWDLPARPRAVLLLAHGAGARFDHRGMEGLAVALSEAGFAVLRFNFPYTEAGRRAPDRQPVLIETWLSVLAWSRQQEETAGLALLAGGRSMGGRMASMAAALQPDRFGVEGLAFFAYPLHPPRRFDRLRAEHLSSIRIPMLFISGTRDALCDVDLMRAALQPLGDRADLVWLEGADHGFHVPRRSGRGDEDVQREAARAAENWWQRVRAGN